MKQIIVKNNVFEIPKKHRLSKHNRKLIIKTENNTSVERLLEGDFQVQTQFWNLKEKRKSHKGLIEINGEFYQESRK